MNLGIEWYAITVTLLPRDLSLGVQIFIIVFVPNSHIITGSRPGLSNGTAVPF